MTPSSPNTGLEQIDTSKLRPGLAIKQYELLRKLGQGAMGKVFLARDVRLGRRVAIKFLSEDSASWADRFRAEARAIARCQHENIVVVHDIQETTNGAYMVLEYIDGQTLRTWLHDRWHRNIFGDEGYVSSPAPTPVSIAQVLDIMVPVIKAIAHAHHQGVVHRDLKPENIMLSSDGSVKVLDFGIAKLLDPAAYADTAHGSRDIPPDPDFQTRTEVVIGTLPYMSPEHFGDRDLDARSDLWSLGIILWEMLTGRHPLEPLPRKLSFEHLLRPIPSISDVRPDLGPVAQAIDHCLRIHKDERIESADLLLEQMEPLFLEQQNLPLHPTGTESDSNPYAGLAAFQETDAHRFFGREQDVDRVIARLHQQRLIAVVGPSGTGKSSFIRAGVIATLKRSTPPWKSYTIRPGREPLLALSGVLTDIANTDNTVDLSDQPGYLGVALRKESRRSRVRILLFIDQFEELYTLGAPRETRAAFIRSLEGAADDVTSPIRVILSLRSDFLDRVTEDRAFSNELVQGMMLLSSMSRDNLRRTVTAPLETSGVRFENDTMVETALDTLDLTRSPLPLLQFTMSKLWDLRDREQQLITQASYTDLGGVEGALASHADAVLAGLSRGDRQLVRLIFTQLVTEDDTRAVLSTNELRALVPDSTGDSMEHLVQTLAQARLLSLETDDRRGTLVELSHESLIERWPKLRQWREEGQEEVRFRSQLRNAAQRWEKRGRVTDMLWQGALVAEAERWQDVWQTSMLDIGPVDQQFLRAVLAHDRRVRRRRVQAFVAAFIFVTAVAFAVSILAYRAQQAAILADAQARYAEEKAREAETQAKEATKQAIRARNATRMATARENQDDPTLVLALIRDIEPAYPPARWRELARWALREGVARRVFEYSEPVLGMDVSSDGTRIAVASANNAARIQVLNDHSKSTFLTEQEDDAWNVAFSPSGRLVATVSTNRTIQVWPLNTSKPPQSFAGHQDRVLEITFSPDERVVATASFDKTARIWPLDGATDPIIFDDHEDAVVSVAFSPDGRHLATSSWDGKVRLYDRSGPPALKVFSPHDSHRISSVAFDPTGRRLVTSAWDNTVRVWPIDEKRPPIILRGHTNRVNSVVFSSDGQRIVSGSDDRTVRVWSADGSKAPIVFRGHTDSVQKVHFHPDGRHLLSASIDKTVRMWAIDEENRTITLHGHQGNVMSAMFSPDGTRVVTASTDNTARIWNANGQGSVVVLRGHRARVASAAFSPDGTRIVTASADKTARIWDTKGNLLNELKGHDDRVWSAAFSPDGTRIVTASWDKTIRVWPANGKAPIQILEGHTEKIWSASFSPDGTQIVSASEDKTSRIWSVSRKAPPIILRGHSGYIYSASFSPDGQRILTASADKTLRLWSITGDSLKVLTGHESVALAGTFAGQGAFSPDGQRAVSLAYDKTIRIWPLDESGDPLVMQEPHMAPYSAAFSPDGTRLVTASHAVPTPEANANPDREEQVAKIWRIIELDGLKDPLLWTSTSYCPSVEKRMTLLSISKALAEKHLASCVKRVRQFSR